MTRHKRALLAEYFTVGWNVIEGIVAIAAGIIAGSMLVFIPATGELVIPSLMGRADSPMIGRVINDEFSLNRDWPVASAIAVALLLMLVVPIMIYNHYQSRADVACGAGQ